MRFLLLKECNLLTIIVYTKRFSIDDRRAGGRVFFFLGGKEGWEKSTQIICAIGTKCREGGKMGGKMVLF